MSLRASGHVLGRGAGVFAALLWLLSPVLLPFIAGMALAYLLDPLTRRVERTGLGRALSALIVIALIIVALVVIVILVAPILGDQLFAFIDNIPKLHGAAAGADLRIRTGPG